MINIHGEIGIQWINVKSEDQTHIEIRTDFIRRMIVNTVRLA